MPVSLLNAEAKMELFNKNLPTVLRWCCKQSLRLNVDKNAATLCGSGMIRKKICDSGEFTSIMGDYVLKICRFFLKGANLIVNIMA